MTMTPNTEGGDSTSATTTFPAGVSLGVTHGTLECRDIPRSRSFYRDFLGLQTLRHCQPAFMTWRSDGPDFVIACVEAGEDMKPQSRHNRWELSLGTSDEVRAAHEFANAQKAQLGIKRVDALGEQDGFLWFCLQDVDGNWWGLSNRDIEWFDAVFNRQTKKQSS